MKLIEIETTLTVIAGIFMVIGFGEYTTRGGDGYMLHFGASMSIMIIIKAIELLHEALVDE